jgi:predicted DNA-binding ribbon-helix-helix protein
VSNKRSVTIARHRTSVSLEEEFWTALGEFASKDGKSVAALIGEIDKGRGAEARDGMSLSSAIRLYVLKRLRKNA